MEKENNLSRLENLVLNYYSEHKSTKAECCKAVYGRVNPFLIENISAVEGRLRKKGFLIYSINGIMRNIEDEDIKGSEFLVVQKRMGRMMVGITKSNVRLIEVTVDPEVRHMQFQQLKEMSSLLYRARITSNGQRNITNKNKKVKARPQTAKSIQG